MKNTIRLWHPYRADFIRRGHRKAERLTTRAPVDVELPALSSSELSVVGHVVKGSLAWARAGAGDDGDVVEYRGWNGDLFAPARALGGQRIDPAFWSNAITADETMASTPDLEKDVRTALGLLQVDAMRREASILVAAAHQAAQAMLDRADALEAGFTVSATPRA